MRERTRTSVVQCRCPSLWCATVVWSLLICGILLSSRSVHASGSTHGGRRGTSSIHRISSHDVLQRQQHQHFNAAAAVQEKSIRKKMTSLSEMIVFRGGTAADAAAATTQKKKSDVVERVAAAVGMGIFLAAIIKYLGESGLIGLTLLLQVGMFGEVCSVVDSYRGTGTTEGGGPLRWHRWLWFFAAQSATSLCALVSTTSSSSTSLLTRSRVDLLSFSLVALSLVSGVVFLNSSCDDDDAAAATDRFRWYLSEVATSVLALLILLGGSSCLILTLRTFGMEWLGLSFLLIITNDTAAYVFGRWLGRNPLLPRLSPKKTWEGFLGALATTVVVAGPLARGLLRGDNVSQQQQQHAVILAIFGSVVAPFGGFLASAVKRAHGAKDFGALLPGHGGLVDRLDCQLVMAPFVYLYLRECL